MTKRKITYIINSVSYGGAQIGMVRLVSELPPDKFDLTVVTLKYADTNIASELPDHVSLIEIGAESKFAIHELLPLQKILSTSDIVVCSLFQSVIVGTILSQISFDPPKIYCWRHNTKQTTRLRKKLYKFSYDLSNGILVDSESTKRQMLNWGFTNEKMTKLPIAGISVNDYPSANHTANGKIRIGTVGRLVEQKGYTDVIKCAKKLPDYEFHIVGDGPLKKELQQSPDNVICHGRVNQKKLHQIRESLDIYFQPSRYEGLCITGIEAMASGLPVVASNVDGLTESVVDNKTGFLVEQGDISGYCSKIKELAVNPELRNKFAKAGQKRVEKKYSAKVLASQFQEAIL